MAACRRSSRGARHHAIGRALPLLVRISAGIIGACLPPGTPGDLDARCYWPMLDIAVDRDWSASGWLHK